MAEAGGRLFVEVTGALASPASRAALLDMAGRTDPLTADALQTIIERGFVRSEPVDDGADRPAAAPPPTGRPSADFDGPLAVDPAIVDIDRLRAEWASETPEAHTFTLLQSVWLTQARAAGLLPVAATPTPAAG